MILQHGQIASLLDAHLNLDGSPDAPSKFTAKTRYSLAKNTRILTTRMKDIEKARQGIVRVLAPTTFNVKKDTPEAVEFTKQWEKFEQETEDVENLMRFTIAELNLDVNPIPIAVLSKLGPVIIEDEPASSAEPAK